MGKITNLVTLIGGAIIVGGAIYVWRGLKEFNPVQAIGDFLGIDRILEVQVPGEGPYECTILDHLTGTCAPKQYLYSLAPEVPESSYPFDVTPLDQSMTTEEWKAFEEERFAETGRWQ